MTRRCRCCERNDAPPGFRFCDVCRAHAEAIRLCHQCGAEKNVRRRGDRLCDNCRPRRLLKPCRGCGERVPKNAPGSHWCPDCAPIVHSASVTRNKAKAGLLRKPCRGCLRPKGPGQNRIYCDACLKARNAPRKCVQCGVGEVTQYRGRKCDACKARNAEGRRQRRAVYDRARREAGLMKDRKRKPLTRAQKARDRESRRMQYRLELIKTGRPLPAVEYQRDNCGPRLPAKPLADVVLRVKRRRLAGNPWDDLPRPAGDGGHGESKVFWEWLEVSERAVNAWARGERESVSFQAADVVLTKLGLNWWDVWDGEDYEAASEVFEGEQRAA